MSSKVPMTARGAERLREELKELKQVERPEVIKAIAEALCSFCNRAPARLGRYPGLVPPRASLSSDPGSSESSSNARACLAASAS